MAVWMALGLALLTAAGALGAATGQYRGETSQGRPVRLSVSDDGGTIRHGAISVRLGCDWKPSSRVPLTGVEITSGGYFRFREKLKGDLDVTFAARGRFRRGVVRGRARYREVIFQAIGGPVTCRSGEVRFAAQLCRPRDAPSECRRRAPNP